MSTLLTTYSVTTIVLILIIAIPALVKFVKWILDLVKAHKANQQSAFEQGAAAAHEEEELEERFEAGEEFMQELDQREDLLEQLLQNQQAQLDSLIRSDNLNIKRDIKRTWERVVKFRKPIDAYDLSLLQDRFEIYRARGGNSWAHDLMKQIQRAATTTSAVDTDNEDQDI